MAKKIKNSMWKYILPAIILIFMPHMIVKASDTGTMLFHFPKEAAGLEIEMYKVADYDLDTFTYTEDFAVNSETLLKWKDSEEMQEAADKLSSFAESENIAGTEESVSQDGKIIFSGLADGLYLIRQEEEHARYQMSPTLVAVPCRIDTGEVTRYVDAYPKIVEKPTTDTPDEPKIPETDDKHSEKTTKTGNNVKTGDNASIAFYIGFGMVSLCIGTVLYRKKRN